MAGVIVATALLVLLAPASAANGPPSGEAHFGQATIEPAYNDMNGQIIYILTPEHAPEPVNSNQSSLAPLYLVVCPTGSTVGTLSCMVVPVNCPDHDGLVAGAAAALVPGIYGSGVLGHDHLLAPPASGGDFNIVWQVFIVLFTNSSMLNTHITTLAEITAQQDAGNVMVLNSGIVFICAVVPANVYNQGTPVGN